MEPSGVMDSESSIQNNYHDLNFCDTADEEVHFSRAEVSSGRFVAYSVDSSESSIEYEATKRHRSQPNIHSHNYPQSLPSFTNVELGFYQLRGGLDSDEQVKSNKLLNRIGSRLRQSSHYLVVPKLVGHYLLGITIQNWSEFFNTGRMSKPPSNTQLLTRRLINNLSHFQGNYLCVSLVLIFYCILSSPLLLLAIIAYLVALYTVTARSAIGKHMRILAFRPNLQQQYSFITLISLPILWVAGAPSAVFWVIGATFVVVGLHASIYNQEEQLLQQQVSALSSNFSDNLQVRNLSGTKDLSSTIQYYNHYPSTGSISNQRQPYLPIPSSRSSSVTFIPYTQAPQSSSNWYSTTLTHWMPFGNSKHNQEQKLVSPASTKEQQHSKLSDVTVISQDYAGLGRVYEI